MALQSLIDHQYQPKSRLRRRNSLLGVSTGEFCDKSVSCSAADEIRIQEIPMVRPPPRPALHRHVSSPTLLGRRKITAKTGRISTSRGDNESDHSGSHPINPRQRRHELQRQASFKPLLEERRAKRAQRLAEKKKTVFAGQEQGKQEGEQLQEKPLQHDPKAHQYRSLPKLQRMSSLKQLLAGNTEGGKKTRKTKKNSKKISV